MINFTEYPIDKFKMYGGMSGNKIGIVYQDETYMIKFPPPAKRSKALSYSNSSLSEYLSCHIIESLGLKAQETLLGTFGDKTVVACKDFELDGYRLREFALLKNTIIDSEQQGYGTELKDILETIETQTLLDAGELEAFFWEMFVVDAFLGNFDRHNANWGFLINEKTGDVQIAPIYDCGSCLYPQISPFEMEEVLEGGEALADRLYRYPTSAIKYQEAKINYAQFLVNYENTSLRHSLERITSTIDFDRIDRIISETPSITDLQKRFYQRILRERKEHLLDFALEVHRSKDQEHEL